jgi:hypothetical protein
MHAPFLLRALVVSGVCLAASLAEAQPLSTFRWQLQPYCNVVTVNVTQQGAVYTMDGYDDQCGAARRSSGSAHRIRMAPSVSAGTS